jgi:hypothetical protein
MLKFGQMDVFAANKATLFELSDTLPGARVLGGRICCRQHDAGIKGIHKHDQFNVKSSYAPARLKERTTPRRY